MTKGQIEDLRDRTDTTPGAITEPVVRNAELDRLLNEREALLVGLKTFIEMTKTIDLYGSRPVQDLASIVLFAEAPAP